MAVGILLVTHGKLGQYLLETMEYMIGELPLRTDALEVHRVMVHEGLLRQGHKLIDKLDSGQGVLMLTDAFGSTPSNIASKLVADARTRLVAGVNLPMLVRIFNYPNLGLDDMTRNAVEGGQRGIIACPRHES